MTQPKSNQSFMKTECRKCGKITKNPTYCSRICAFGVKFDGTKKYCRNCEKWKSVDLLRCDYCGRKLATKPHSTVNKDPNRWDKAYAI